MTATVVVPVTPGSPQAIVVAAGVVADVQKAISDAGGDVETAVTNLKAMFAKAEGSNEANAFKSFVGSLWKSGRGGACLALVGAIAASFFAKSFALETMIGVLAALVATAPNVTGFFSRSTKGEPVWVLVLALIAVALVGAGGLYIVQDGGLALVKSFIP